MKDDIQKLILTWDEYRAKEFDVPYLVEIEKEGQKLIYIGVRHLFDPGDRQFELIRNTFESFAALPGKKMVLVEGGTNWPVLESAEESIRKYGEPSFVTFLAQHAHIAITTPEPDKSDILSHLRSKFTDKKIWAHKIAQYALHYSKIQDKPTEDEYIEGRMIKGMNTEDGAAFKNAEEIRTLFAKEFGVDLNLADRKFFYDHVDPSQNNSVFNQISREADVIRDSRIVENILRLWEQGNSIFVVYGSAHAVNQERALRVLCR